MLVSVSTCEYDYEYVRPSTYAPAQEARGTRMYRSYTPKQQHQRFKREKAKGRFSKAHENNSKIAQAFFELVVYDENLAGSIYLGAAQKFVELQRPN
jgi:hypothetical protein